MGDLTVKFDTGCKYICTKNVAHHPEVTRPKEGRHGRLEVETKTEILIVWT